MKQQEQLITNEQETLKKQEITEISSDSKSNNVKWKKYIFIVIKLLILILLCLSFTRTPYIGVFFDSTIFTIPFGYTKYFAYLFFAFLIIYSFAPTKNKKWFNYKTLFNVLVVWLFIAIIISSIGIQIDYNPYRNDFKNFSDYFINNKNSYFEFWKTNDWGKIHSPEYSFYLNPRSYGGLLSFLLVILFEFVAPIVLAILIAIALFLFVGLKFNKYYQTQLKFRNNNEKKSTKINTNKDDNIICYLDLLQSKKLKTPIQNINQLSNYGFDDYSELEILSKKLANKIKTYFKSINIDPVFDNKEIMFKSIIHKYIFRNKKEINRFNNNLESFKIEFTNMDVEYYFEKEDELVIIQNVKVKSVISLHEVINDIESKDNFNVILGKLANRKSIYFNALQQPTSIIFGSKGSGSTMLLSNAILSLCLLNNKHLLNVNIIDTSGKSLKNLANLPHVNRYIDNNDEAINLLDEIIKLIDEREIILTTNKCSNIYEYNNKFDKKELINQNLLVINDLEELLLSNNKNEVLIKLEKIISKAYKLGIIVLVLLNIIDDELEEIINKFNNLFVLKLDSEQDSIKLLGSPKSHYLAGSGDAILKTKNNEYHFQTFFVNKDEINQIINLINGNTNE